MSESSCPAWCVGHSEAFDYGTVHHSEARGGPGLGHVSVWVFRLPGGTVRIGVGSLTLAAPDEYGNDAADLARLLDQLGHAELAAAVTAAAELAGAE